MNNMVDFTKMKPNKKLRLVKCPACGKTGELHKYTSGEASIAHSGKIQLGFLSIDNHCFFKTWE